MQLPKTLLKYAPENQTQKLQVFFIETMRRRVISHQMKYRETTK